MIRVCLEMEEANKKRSELIVSIFPVVGRSNILTQ